MVAEVWTISVRKGSLPVPLLDPVVQVWLLPRVHVPLLSITINRVLHYTLLPLLPLPLPLLLGRLRIPIPTLTDILLHSHLHLYRRKFKLLELDLEGLG